MCDRSKRIIFVNLTSGLGLFFCLQKLLRKLVTALV